MKIRDLIEKLDKSNKFENEVDITRIANELDIHVWIDYIYQERLKSYYFGDWYCTDTKVGYKVYFFDNEPVAISYKICRKCDEDFEWSSKESYNKVKEYILTFTIENEPKIDLFNFDDEIGDTYKIEYHSQLYEYHKDIPLYNGNKVQIIEKAKGENCNKNNQYLPSLVKIKLEDKSEKWVELKELVFPFNIIKE